MFVENDITLLATLKTIYNKLMYLVEYLKLNFFPNFNVHILKPEIKIGDPRFVTQDLKNYNRFEPELIFQIIINIYQNL